MSSKLRRYIETEPQQPSGFKFKTAILVSDSKGYTLRNACSNYEFPFENWCIPGARTKQLVDLIQERIEKAINRHNNIVIYLWAGTCDLTAKEGKFIQLRHYSDKSVNEVIEQCKRAIKIVDRHSHAEIKFVDCPILSIVNWNKHKKHPKALTYRGEDFKLTRQIKKLNSKIVELNNSIFKNTVRTSRYYFRGRPSKRGKTRKSVNIAINKPDGVHPGKLLSLAITKQLRIDT